MKTLTIAIGALFALAMIGCHNTEDANEKITECIEEEYGEEKVDDMLPAWELTCEDGDEICDECVDCVMDAECDALFDGDCQDSCK